MSERSRDGRAIQENLDHRVMVVVVGDPGGGPPDWIRQAWLGVEFEAQATCRLDNSWRTSPAKESFENYPAWEVPATDAIDALREAGQDRAADWWVNQGYYVPDYRPGFHITTCQTIEGEVPIFPDLN